MDIKDSSDSTELSANKSELLSYLLEEEGIELPERQAISRHERQDEVLLSFAQQRLWFLDQLEPGKSIYNIPKAMRISGPLKVDALGNAFDALAARHEVLRTTFANMDGNPRQVISQSRSVELTITDLSERPEAERQEEAQRLLKEEAERPFDLSQDLMLRATLLRLGPEEHILLIVMHHIASDGWSMGILSQELALLYEAFCKGNSSPLPDLSIQYADFAHWQRGWLQGDVLEAQFSYWKEQLGEEPPVLELPTDRPRPAIHSYRGKRQRLVLSKTLSESLNSLSRREGVTLFMTLLAAFVTLLYRYSGQEDIVVGSPIAGRTRVEIEGLIGFFVNTLVLRTDLSGNPTFLELLGRVRETALATNAHQDLPFEKLVEELQPERDLSMSPLFQVMFILQNAPGEALELPGLTLSPLEMDNETAKFDLTLSMIEGEGGLRGSIEYNTDLFEEATIERMLGHYETLLEGIVADPEQRLSELPLLTAAERYELLVEWNDTEREYPKGKLIHQLFETQVERTPDAVALVFEDQELTYRELNARANKLAHYLRRLGVGAETLVGIFVERSLEMVVGVLGILKAGGAYVPLDPTFPKERLAFMLEDAQVSLLLTQGRMVEALPQHTAQLVCLDAGWQAITQESEDNPLGEVKADNLAYVIYTSGSTGRPKGVQIEHRGVVNLLHFVREQPGLMEKDTLLSVTTLSFDIVVSELFLPLSVGARVVVVSHEVASDGKKLLETLIASGATFLQPTPITWRLLLEAGWSGSDQLKMVSTGEALPRELANRLLPKGVSLWNLYGPTETTIWSTAYQVDSENGVIPIGRPIANTQIYILDQHLQLVPVGVAGELHIGGEGLARGYLNRPELTVEKFVPNPFNDDPGELLYKTGDLARYLPDGNIECLGRIDYQVKIRGFRIELGEIEEVLSGHVAVGEAVAVVQEDESVDGRLVAYVVPSTEQTPTTSKLRRFLKEKLPEYMVPSAFVILDILPLTPNGKVDRQALPAPDRSRPEIEETFVAPCTPIEGVIAKTWSEVLGIEEMGIHDNFFELGGHSLLATQIISRLCEAFQIELPLRSLFESPTIEELARVIVGEQGANLPGRQAIPRRERTDELYLSFAQQRLWFLDQLEPDKSVYNISKAVRISGSLNVEALQKTLDALVARHEVLRTTFANMNGSPRQVVAQSRSVELMITDLIERPEAEREEETQRLLKEEAGRPFDLSQDLMLRATLLRLGPEEHILLIVMHHIASDGWSMGILSRELSLFYEGFSKRETPLLPELPIQYVDFAYWQQGWLQGGVLEQQLSYWKEQLGGGSSLLELPTDRPRPAIQTYRGARQHLVLSKTLSESLNSLSRREGVTLFMTLLSAFVTLLYRYSGQEDIVVGSPIAGRTRVEIEDLIGFFVNTLVLRTDLSGNPSFRELLGRVRETALAANAHQDLPFEKLVEELQPERDLSMSPLFQVMFTLQNAPGEVLELPGLTLSPLEMDNETAKFDLTLSMIEGEGGLRGSIEYNTDLFEEATIERMLGHYETLLEGIVADPEQQLSHLPLLTEGERHQLLVEWNDTRRDYPKDKPIHQLFEAQVERTPEAVAVVFDDQELTYRELNDRANRLAHHLRRLGVGSETLVGIYVERSLEMVVGLLGILKAGGAYLPLDPSYPQERLAFMLEDTKALVLLTQQRLVETLPQHRAQVVCLDSDWEVVAQEKQENPAGNVDTDNLAYVIYTSGSTGIPKGVMISHRAIANHMVWMQADYPLTEADRVVQKTPFSFDASVWEFFAPLLAGARLIMARPGGHQEGAYLVELIAGQKVTVLQLVPSMLRMLLEEKEIESCNCLRRVFCGGETLPVELQEQFFIRLDADLYNLYGPTEACIDATGWTSKRKSNQQIIPIGCPIANTQVYILDSYLQPVPVGITGELHIGGDGLSRGYLNRPELTAEKFIPNPFSDRPGACLYKTGDLGRYLSDGNIEFLGRIDHQVKIRGFRVELGEIEVVLGGHLTVREVAVLRREDEPGEVRLVAYVVPNREREPTISELRRFLQEKLPDYMIPSNFVILEALPLTPSGKVDRFSLPVPDTARPEIEDAFVAPRSPIEEILAGIWAQLLGFERVGIHDNFFELGGHSLLATQVISRLRDAFQIELPLRSLFDSPSIEELSRVIVAEQEAKSPQKQTISRRERPDELYLSFAQQRLWFLDQLEPNSPLYNISKAMRISGPLDVDVLGKVLDSIVVRHEVLRTTFASVDGNPRQVISPSRSVGLAITNLSERPEAEREEEAQRLLKEEAGRPFDLSQDLMLRPTLLKLGTEEHILLLVMHHIASDGWSLGILSRELALFYEAFSEGEIPSLPELPIQYSDFARWQQDWLNGDVLEEQLAYWKEKLRDSPPVLELPTDRPRPAVQTHRGEHQHLVLSKTLSESLNSLGRREGVTLFMTLLSAFVTLLYRYSGQEDIVVGSPIAGRTRVEIEELIGFFVNTLVLRTDLSDNPIFLEVLGRVREAVLAADAHQDLPFEKLVEELKSQRDLSRTPLFQVFFNMLNLPNTQIELPNLKVEILSLLEVEAKFDLTLYVKEQNEGIQFDLVYNTNLFKRDRMVEMLAQFKYLLAQIVEDPKESIVRFSLVTPTAQAILPNPTEALDSTWEGAVHTIFSKQAYRVPERLAVVDGQESWTYKELDARSNQLANYLLDSNIQSQEVLAIYGHRNASLVWALLGVLKAGAAFVILDPAYPPSSLIDYLGAAKPRGFIQIGAAGVLPSLLEKFVQTLSCRLVLPQRQMAEVGNLLKDYSTEDPEVEVGPDDLTYVAFTSGSTGKPKGILGGHKPLSHFLQWHTQTFALDETDRFSMLSGLSHDSLLRDIFTPLWLGATLCIPDQEVIVSPGQLSEWMRQKEISIAHLTPVMGHLLTERTEGKTLPSLRYAFFGGDVLTKRDVSRLGKLAPAATCVNFYGATETPQAMGHFIVSYEGEVIDDPASADVKEGVPLGRGIGEAQLLVLNDSQGHAGVGELGEIYIRSPHLAKGYLNDDTLTQDRFMANPFMNTPGDRVYKSGDLGRYMPDGNIEFLGRSDLQVKIRGFRIELGEIETVLLRHPAVGEAVVIRREDKLGEVRLVAYIVPNPEREPSISELRRFLQEKLPDYMIPSNFIILDALPLTPSGKVDRRALPTPDTTRPEIEEAFVAPRGPIEKMLAGIWAQLLGLEQVGIHDNFFELGGHSLLATQVVFRVGEVFQVDLPLHSLFEMPTIAQLAREIARKQIEGADRQTLAQTLAELKELSEDEVQELLAIEKGLVEGGSDEA